MAKDTSGEMWVIGPDGKATSLGMVGMSGFEIQHPDPKTYTGGERLPFRLKLDYRFTGTARMAEGFLCSMTQPNANAMVHLDWEQVSINQPHPEALGVYMHTRRCAHCGYLMQDSTEYEIDGYLMHYRGGGPYLLHREAQP